MDPFSNLVDPVKKSTGNGDSEMKFEQGSDMAGSKFLSRNCSGRERIKQRGSSSGWEEPLAVLPSPVRARKTRGTGREGVENSMMQLAF